MSNNQSTQEILTVPAYIDKYLPDESLIEARRVREVLKYLYANTGEGESSLIVNQIIKQVFGQDTVPEVADILEDDSILSFLSNGIKPRSIQLPNGSTIGQFITGHTEPPEGLNIEVGPKEIVFIIENYKAAGSNTYNATRVWLLAKPAGVYGKPSSENVKALLQEDFILISNNFISLVGGSTSVKTIEEAGPDPRGNVSLNKKVILWEDESIPDNTPGYNNIPVVNKDTGKTVFLNKDDLTTSGNIQVTKAQLDDLISNSELKPGSIYEISGCDESLYGGTTLILKALTTNKLGKSGYGIFYNPKYDQEVEGYGIYDVDTDYSANDTTIWGGRKWVCKSTTANEEPIDQFTLDDTKWDVVPYNDTDYNVAFDEIKYDYENDWIAERHEVEGGNIVSCSKATYDLDMNNGQGFGYNSIKIFQWGNVYTENLVVGNSSNIVNESWFDCINSKGYIYSNTLNSSSIYSNTLNSGTISYNTLNMGGSISYNTLNMGGSISYNTLNGGSSIYNNTLNSGSYIYNNTLNSGSSISSNTLNGGSISINTLNGGGIIFGTITTNINKTILCNVLNQITLGATAKTILSSNYSKEVKTNSNNETVIQYLDGDNALRILPITE